MNEWGSTKGDKTLKKILSEKFFSEHEFDKRKGDDIKDNLKAMTCQKERCVEVPQDRFQLALQVLQQFRKDCIVPLMSIGLFIIVILEE